MKTRTDDLTKQHEGHAIFNGIDRLSIYLEKAEKNRSFFHLLFVMGNTGTANDNSHFYGVSSKMDAQGSPTGRIEILVKENFDFNKTAAKTIKINSREYRSEDHDYDGLLTYLTGRSNRVVVSKKTVNAKFKRTNEHNEFFYAACYLSKKAMKKDEAKKALIYLYQAYLHGFPNNEEEFKLLNIEIKESFNNIAKYKITAVPDHVKLPALNLKGILKLMTSKNL
jgi:hypothetical protein